VAVTDDAILKIRQMIVSGELTPGSRIPPERELVERLGASRNSIREAVKALEVIGILDVRRGDGTYVTSLEPGVLLEALTIVSEVYTDESLIELFAARSILEAAAAGLAAARITPEQVAELTAMVGEVSDEDSVERLIAHDLAFHRRIVEISGNRYVKSFVDGLSPRTVQFRTWRALTQVGAVAATLKEHRDIVGALERGNVSLASSLVEVHISVESWLRDSGVPSGPHAA